MRRTKGLLIYGPLDPEQASGINVKGRIIELTILGFDVFNQVRVERIFDTTGNGMDGRA